MDEFIAHYESGVAVAVQSFFAFFMTSWIDLYMTLMTWIMCVRILYGLGF